jgi:RHS repeat-associated protein
VNLRSGVDQVYTTDPLTNRYTAIDSPSQTLFYDAAGNLTQDRDGYRYVYDYENRITRIFKLSGQTEITVAQYAYDALGRRIWKYDPTAAAPNVYYTYNDQWQILAEYTSDTTCRQWFTYGNYIDEVLSRSTHPMLVPAIQFYSHDHLYSPAALANYLGATVLERYEYDAYGNVQILNSGFSVLSSSQYANPFTFTGRQLDILDAGNLHHMHYRHRDYSPKLGRFMQHDPLGINPGYSNLNPFGPMNQYHDSRNVYEYVISQALRGIDPYGLTTIMFPYRWRELPYPTQDPWYERCHKAAGDVHSRVHKIDKFMRHCTASCELTKEMGNFCAWIMGTAYELGPGRRRNIRQDLFNNKIGRSCANDVDECGDKPYKSCEECCEDNRNNQWKDGPYIIPNPFPGPPIVIPGG